MGLGKAIHMHHFAFIQTMTKYDTAILMSEKKKLHHNTIIKLCTHMCKLTHTHKTGDYA